MCLSWVGLGKLIQLIENFIDLCAQAVQSRVRRIPQSAVQQYLFGQLLESLAQARIRAPQISRISIREIVPGSNPSLLNAVFELSVIFSVGGEQHSRLPERLGVVSEHGLDVPAQGLVWFLEDALLLPLKPLLANTVDRSRWEHADRGRGRSPCVDRLVALQRRVQGVDLRLLGVHHRSKQRHEKLLLRE